MKKILMAALAGVVVLGAVGCRSEADIASENISKDAEDFKIERHIVFYNSWLGVPALEVVGFCSVEQPQDKYEITCKNGDGTILRHGMGKSTHVTPIYRQLEGARVSTYHTRIRIAPQQIIPDFDLKFDGNQAVEAVTPD